MTAPAGPLHPSSTGTRLELRVMPRSPRNEIGGVRDGRLLVRVTAPPVDDAANDAVVRALAARLKVPVSRIRLVIGQTSRSKVVEIDGLTPLEVRNRLDVR